MATIHQQDGFAFRIYPRDHEPPHVHAIVRGKGEVKKDATLAEGIAVGLHANFYQEWLKIRRSLQ